MANTYFNIAKTIKTDPVGSNSSYTTDYKLSLTAYVAAQGNKGIQLTIQTNSTIPGQSGIAYYTLDSEEVMKLIGGLMERLVGPITATGEEKSSISYNE